MIRNNENMHPFVGAGTVFESPLGPSDFKPKAWGAAAGLSDLSATLSDIGQTFISKGVAIGDPIFLISATPPLAVATTVAAVPLEWECDMNWVSDDVYTNVLYKVGEEALHTFTTLINIISARGIDAYTIHWLKCWCSGRFKKFRPDEKGDVYVIDPEEERALGGMNRVNGALVIRPTPEEIAAASVRT